MPGEIETKLRQSQTADEIQISRKPRGPGWMPKFQSLEDVTQQETLFLWRPYIPVGAVTMLFGYGGLGKSWITHDLAAALSSGRTLIGHTEPYDPQKVLIVSAEDDPGRIIKPRLLALGANMNNIYVSEEAFILDRKGVKGLEDAMVKFSATILFIDPLVSYLGEKMDMNKSNESRAMMGPLGEAARRTGTAVVVVAHSRKDAKGRSANRAMGSADFTNGVRSALMVDEAKSGAKFMAHVKHNWSAEGPTLFFSTEDDNFKWLTGTDEMIAETISRQPLASKDAIDFLKRALFAGARPVLDLVVAAASEGINERTLQRSKKGIAVARKMKDHWVWELAPGVEGIAPRLEIRPAEVEDPLLGPVTQDEAALLASMRAKLAAQKT